MSQKCNSNNNKRRKMSYSKFGYLFILPFIIIYLVFSLYPLLNTFWYSGSNMTKPQAKFWGFKNIDVYYDKYLDFEAPSVKGILFGKNKNSNLEFDFSKYKKIKNYFELQKIAADTKPFEQGGIDAINKAIENGDFDDVDNSVKEKLTELFETRDFSTIDEKTISSLSTWQADNLDETAFIIQQFRSIKSTIEGIQKNSESKANSGTDNASGNATEKKTLIETIDEKDFDTLIKAIETVISGGSVSNTNDIATDIIDNNATQDMTSESTLKTDTNVVTTDNSNAVDAVNQSINTTDNQGAVTTDVSANANEKAIIKYLDGYIQSKLEGTTEFDFSDKVGANLTNYLNGVRAGNISAEDTLFYYVCKMLSKPSVTAINNGSKVSVPVVVDVPFFDKLTDYFSVNIWQKNVGSLDIVELFPALMDDKSLHSNEQTLLSDLVKLQEEGIVAQKFIIDGNELKVDDNNDIYAVFKYFVDEQITSDPNLVVAVNHVTNIIKYASSSERKDIIADGSIENIDSYIAFDNLDKNNINVELYRKFKKDIGMDELLSMNKYNEYAESYMRNKKSSQQESIADKEKKLAKAKEAYDADKSSDDLRANYESAKNTLKSTKAERLSPLFEQVNASERFVFVGVRNFGSVFADVNQLREVLGSFYTTGVVWIIGFIPQMLVALLLSAWFTDTKIKLKGINFMKGMMYLPNVITAVTIAVFFGRVFEYSTGGSLSLSQQVLHLFGKKEGYNFFDNPWATRGIVAFINFWMWYGNTMIVLIAGITSISVSLYESAQIDGANSFQTYMKITLPLLRPIMLYTLVSSLIGGLQMFDIPQNIVAHPTQIKFLGMRTNCIQTVMMHINSLAFGGQDKNPVGIASVVAILLFITTTILSMVIFYIMRDKDQARINKAKKLAKKMARKEGMA